MATVHFSGVKNVRLEIHEMPDLGRTAIHILIDTQPFKGDLMHEEAIIMWNGSKDSFLKTAGLCLVEDGHEQTN